MGTKQRSLLAWTSEDAQTWERTPITGIDPTKGDQISSITGLDDGGFVAVGGRWKDDKTWPRMWTSPDGVAWTVRRSTGHGWLHEVASKGHRVVAVGSDSLDEVTKGRSQRSLLFFSVNSGATWTSFKVNEPADSRNFVSSLTDVVATETGFMVGGRYYSDEGTYRPMVQIGSGVESWRNAVALPLSGESSGISDLVQVGDATVAMESVSQSGKKDRLKAWYLFGDSFAWTPGKTPGSSQSLWTTAAAAVGETAVFAVSVDGNPVRSRLWRHISTGRVSSADVQPPAGTRTNVQPDALLVADGILSAFGDAQGKPALWSADASGFGTPTELETRADEVIHAVRWSAAGGYLVTGTKADDHAFTLHSADGKSWRRTGSVAFNKVAQYHWSTINDAAWAHGRWVIVGAKSTNGSVRHSALAFTSTTGTIWTEGRPTKVTARGDWYNGRSPLDDLHGLDNRSRSMSAVLGVKKGLVAVGSTTKGQNTRPAAWLSTDNRSWRLVALPSKSYPEAAPATVHRVGDVLVASGWARASGATRTVRATWRSTDGGRNWLFTATEGTQAYWQAISSDTEFLQIVTAEDERKVSLFRSTDGATWSESPIEIAGLTDGMEVWVRDAIVHDGALQLMVTLSNRLDAVTVVQRVEL